MRAVFGCLGALLVTLLALSYAKTNKIIIFSGTATDLTALLFAAASLVLTGIGVFVAILALWGYKEIRDKAIAEAVGKAVDEATKAAVKAAKETAEPVAARTASAYLKEKGGQEVKAATDKELLELIKALGNDQ